MRRNLAASLPLVLGLAAALPAQNLGITLVNGVDGYDQIAYSPQVVPQSLTLACE